MTRRMQRIEGETLVRPAGKQVDELALHEQVFRADGPGGEAVLAAT